MPTKVGPAVDGHPRLFVRLGCECLGNSRLVRQAAQSISDLAIDAAGFGCKPRADVNSHVLEGPVLQTCPGS